MQSCLMSLGFRGIQTTWFVYGSLLGHKPYSHSLMPSSASLFLSYQGGLGWNTMPWVIGSGFLIEPRRAEIFSLEGMTPGNEKGFTLLKTSSSCSFFLHSEEVLTAKQICIVSGRLFPFPASCKIVAWRYCLIPSGHWHSFFITASTLD